MHRIREVSLVRSALGLLAGGVALLTIGGLAHAEQPGPYIPPDAHGYAAIGIVQDYIQHPDHGKFSAQAEKKYQQQLARQAQEEAKEKAASEKAGTPDRSKPSFWGRLKQMFN